MDKFWVGLSSIEKLDSKFILALYNHFNNIEKCVESLPYYWSSESARLLKKYFDEDKKESQSLKERFENQVGRLIQIAGVYNDSEKNIASDIETLPNNIID